MSTILTRRSSTPSAIPTTGQLSLGEIAINTYDGKLYIKKDNGTQSIVEIGSSGGGGLAWSTISSTNLNPLVTNNGYVFNTGGTTRTATLPASCPVGFNVWVVAEGGSVRISSNGNTIDDVGSGNDLLLSDGEAVYLVAYSTGVLDIAQALVPGGGVQTALYTVNSGSAEVDFGAFPGASDASVTITGQSGILSTSRVFAKIAAVATVDHSADEHWAETIDVVAGNIVAGVGFTIYAKNTNMVSGLMYEASNRPPDGGDGTRLYGKFTVHWQWS